MSMDHTQLQPPYPILCSQLEALLEHESDFNVNVQNFVALVFHGLDNVNWLGFYWLRGETLTLGPFQGQPACTRIETGQGVCGTSVARQEAVIVDDVHAFDGHIACDAASRSEIVIPVFNSDTLMGVLDVDSPVLSRFGEADERGLTALLKILLQSSATRP